MHVKHKPPKRCFFFFEYHINLLMNYLVVTLWVGPSEKAIIFCGIPRLKERARVRANKDIWGCHMRIVLLSCNSCICLFVASFI